MKKIIFFHPNGGKYFSYLEDSEANMVFSNYVFFRRFLNFHKGDNSIGKRRFSEKFPQNADIAVFCIVPFDPNVVLIVLQKWLFGSRIVYHTSFNDHRKGRFFYILRPLFTYIIKHYVDVIVCTPPSLHKQLSTVYFGKRVLPLEHFIPYEECRKKSVVYDVAFIGERSYKKGFDRFIKLARIYSDLSFVCMGHKVLDVVLPSNVTDLGHISRAEVLLVMCKSDIVIVPSRRVSGWEELYGMVIVEAVFNQCKVLASDHVGPCYLAKRHSQITLVNDSDRDWLNVDLKEFKNVVADPSLFFEEYSAERLRLVWDDAFE